MAETPMAWSWPTCIQRCSDDKQSKLQFYQGLTTIPVASLLVVNGTKNMHSDFPPPVGVRTNVSCP